jgi:HAMP domain-containing protein
MIDLVRPEATRSLALDRYVQSRKAPPAPDLVGLLEGVLAMVELQRPQTPGALQVALDALALADRAKNTKSAVRRDKAADALRSARQELQQAMKVPAPQEHLNWSTARLERMDQQLELAISSLEKGPA